MRADLDALLDAAAGCAAHERTIRFGPLPLTLTSHRHDLIAHAERHAAGDPAGAPWPPLTVHLVDGDVLPADAVPAALVPRSEPGPTYVCHDGGHLATVESSMLWVADADRRRAMRWTHHADDLPVWEAMRPLRFALRWAAAGHGGALLHTAAIAGSRGAALLVGAAGAGKSTTAFACLDRGLAVLGDDYCLVEPADEGIVVHATYLLGTLDDRSLTLLPQVQDRVVGEALRGKSLLRLDALPTGRGSTPAVAMCAVVQAPGETTRVVPTSRAAVARALAPSTLFQIPGMQRETFATLAQVARRLPAYELRVDHPADVPAVLAELLGPAA